MKKLIIWIVVVSVSFVLGLTKPANVQAYSIFIDASGETPTITSDGWPFVQTNQWSFWGPSTITSIGTNAWEIKMIIAGSDYATFGGSNRGLELTDPISGKIVDSFGFNYYNRDSSFWFNTDLVMFDAYLFTADASGNLSGRTPRIYNAQVATAVEDGTFQLAMSNMGTAYGDFDVYLKGRANTSPVPEPSTVLLLGLGLTGVIGFKVKFRRNVKA
jgi:hypothetical protein